MVGWSEATVEECFSNMAAQNIISVKAWRGFLSYILDVLVHALYFPGIVLSNYRPFRYFKNALNGIMILPLFKAVKINADKLFSQKLRTCQEKKKLQLPGNATKV